VPKDAKIRGRSFDTEARNSRLWGKKEKKSVRGFQRAVFMVFRGWQSFGEIFPGLRFAGGCVVKIFFGSSSIVFTSLLFSVGSVEN